MRSKNPKEEPNSSDAQARRLVGLLVAFSNANVPLSSQDIRQSHYPELSTASFLRQFSRDRQSLAEAGLVINRLRHGTDEALWFADRSSFANPSALSAEDALLIDVLCAPLVSDPSFAHRDELRHALAKVDDRFGEVTAARIAPTSQAGEPPLAKLIACLEQRRVALVRYVDAAGNQSERTYAPFGTFGLRDHTYIVCVLVDPHGNVCEDQVRTLRDDRLRLVRPQRQTFHVPADFQALDYRMLPFQIGPSVTNARFLIKEYPEHSSADLSRHAHLVEVRTDGNVWEAPVSSIDDASAWAISEDVIPLAPTELKDAWVARLRRTSAGDAVLVAPLSTQEARLTGATKSRVRGRKPSNSLTRDLIALVGSLRRQGATISVEGIASRLGISTKRAHELLQLVLSACSGSASTLPLGVTDSGDQIVLCFDRGIRGVPLRLTKTEAAALEAALDELGFDHDDQLREDLREAFGPATLNANEARERIGLSMGTPHSDSLEACTRALIESSCLSFFYAGGSSDHEVRRTVRPIAVRPENDSWYLEAFDFNRHAHRTFRLDRMSSLRVTRAPAPNTTDAATSTDNRRSVRLCFEDSHMLELLDWPRLMVSTEAGGSIVATIPFYGGDWLPRQLAACGGTVTTDDAELAQATSVLSQKLLANTATAN